VKKDISQLDWSVLELPILQSNYTWVLPQVLAFFNQVIRLERVSGKISASATLRALHADLLESRVKFQSGRVVSSRELTNLFAYINHSPRGEILTGRQGSSESLRYAAPVPLLLSAFKEYRNVQYQEWDYDDPSIQVFLDKDTQSILPYLGQTFPDFDLLEIRELGRTVKSGAKQGRKTPYASCTAVNGIPDPEFKALPRLVKLMLTQMWLYHPTTRHPLAWTNLQDLDEPAPPLVDAEVFDVPTETRGRKAKPQPELQKLPWQ
jgi:hypothetical protein